MAIHSAQSYLYLKGVFTTIRLVAGQPVVWDKHWRRLQHDANELGIDLSSVSEHDVREELTKTVAEKSVLSGMARISLTDESPGELWPAELDVKPSTVFEVLVRQPRMLPKEFQLTFSPYPVNSRSPLVGVKSCNYLENVLAIEEVKTRGFHEGIRVNERGHITSGCMANVFWLAGDRLYTPALSTGCLPGTTREFVLENLECEEVEVAIDELHSADAIFLTSAGLGIVQAADFDGRALTASDHPIGRLWDDLEPRKDTK